MKVPPASWIAPSSELALSTSSLDGPDSAEASSRAPATNSAIAPAAAAAAGRPARASHSRFSCVAFAGQPSRFSASRRSARSGGGSTWLERGG